MIRSSKHPIKYTNQGKLSTLAAFNQEYRRVAQLYLDYLWSNPIVVNGRVLDISNQQYNCPTYLPTEIINSVTTTLYARALKCCSTQVCGIIKAILEKPRKRLYMLKKLQAEGKDYSNLQRKIDRHPITKPDISNIKPELNSICCDYLELDDGEFNGFIQLKCLGKDFGVIRIPIKYHRQSNKWHKKGRLLTSFLVDDDTITFRWDVKAKPKKSKGLVVGADQGMKDILTLSNGKVTQQTNNHGYTLEAILQILKRKRKGSKAFDRTQTHRKNFINWSINNLNLKGIKQINLERIVNIGKGRRQSRLLSHWTNTEIRDKVVKRCEELGVQVQLQSSTYRSQRCSQCGLVRRSNRKGKEYKCKGCGFVCDSDLNAAKNHEVILPELPFDIRSSKLNIKGFYWLVTGMFSLDGEEFTVPLSTIQGNVIKR